MSAACSLCFLMPDLPVVLGVLGTHSRHTTGISWAGARFVGFEGRRRGVEVVVAQRELLGEARGLSVKKARTIKNRNVPTTPQSMQSRRQNHASEQHDAARCCCSVRCPWPVTRLPHLLSLWVVPRSSCGPLFDVSRGAVSVVGCGMWAVRGS